MKLPSITIDLNDYPAAVAAFEAVDGSEEAFAADEEMENLRDEVLELKGDIEDARRMLLRPEPSIQEAIIYIERALVAVKDIGK